MNIQNYTKELGIAKKLALNVGTFLRESQKKNEIVKQPHGEGYLDVTTAVDLQSERMVLDTIALEFPHDHILSEETHTHYSSDWERMWIVDPLDGTTNYIKGLSAYGISINLVVKGRVMLAVSYLPAYDELFYVVRGRGVFKNDKKLVFATPEDNLAQSLVSVGFPHIRTKEVADVAFGLYRDVWLGASDLRRSAAAVLDGTLLASGLTGAYLTPDIKPWDIASASLFIEEQGGVASDFRAQPLDLLRHSNGRFSTSVIFAKNQKIHDSLQEITKKYNQ